MTFDVDETYRIADLIFKNESIEAGYRSSTNRAYYSAYHNCCVVAGNLNYKPNNKKHANFRHQELIDKLQDYSSNNSLPQPQKTNFDKLWRLLRQVRDLRSKADYQSSISYSHHQAQDALMQSKRIGELAKKIP